MALFMWSITSKSVKRTGHGDELEAGRRRVERQIGTRPSVPAVLGANTSSNAAVVGTGRSDLASRCTHSVAELIDTASSARRCRPAVRPSATRRPSTT